MRILIRHFVALLLFVFVCKVAIQAQEFKEYSGVPKALLLDSLAPEAGIPSREFNVKPIISAIQRH